MNRGHIRMRLVLAVAAVMFAAVVTSALLVQRGNGTTAYTPPDFNTASRAYPMDTLSDVRTHTDAVVLATVLAEREGSSGPIYEGEPLIWRSITVRNDRTLWQKQGAPVPPETFETGGGAWSQSDGTRKPFSWWWGDVGKQYLYVLVKDTGEAGMSWSHEFELLAPIMNGRAPAEISSEKPWFAEIRGKTPDELERLFAERLGAADESSGGPTS